MSKAAPWVAIALTMIAMIVASVAWVPSVAQEAVAAHTEHIDDKQEVEIRELKRQVQTLITAQAVTNERMRAQNSKLDRIIEKLEE